MEIRHVTAQILTQFDVSFAPSQTVTDFVHGQKDAFTLVTAPLMVVFKEREKGTRSSQ
jgi:hypothetical protein